MMKKATICNTIKKIYPIIGIIVLMSIYLIPKENMIVGFDSEEVWKSVQSWFTGERYGTYVLYKGYQALYPYVWLYQLSLIFSVNEWLFIKIFYILLFAVVSTILFPRIAERLFGFEFNSIKSIVLGVLLFYFWIGTGALNGLMVDLPSLFYFLLLVDLALGLYKKRQRGIAYFVFLGISLGLNFGGSGQYTPAALCIIIFLVVDFKKNKKEYFEQEKFWFKLLFFIFAAIGLYIFNRMYMSVVINSMTYDGGEIQTISDWMSTEYIRQSAYYKGPPTTIWGKRDLEIIKKNFGANSEQWLAIEQGEFFPLGIKQYIGLILNCPVDFLVLLFNRVIILFSPDGDGPAVLQLFLFHSCLFICGFFVYLRCKKWRDLFNVKIWIVLAFLAAIADPLLFTPEMRFVISLQGLVVAIAIGYICPSKERIYNALIYKKGDIKEFRLNYTVLCYLFFIVMMMSYIALLYENSARILFEWI